MSKEEVESKSSQCKAVFLDTDNKPVHPSIHPLSVTALSLLWGHGVLFFCWSETQLARACKVPAVYQEQFGVQYRAQGHFNMQLSSAWSWDLNQ